MSAWDGLGSLVSSASQATTGVVTAADIEALFKAMYDNARTEPDYFFVSPETVWLLRRARIYGVNHAPRRKLRKCFARKRNAVMSRGIRRLRRLQRAKEYQ
jgi:hypothetical protein